VAICLGDTSTEFLIRPSIFSSNLCQSRTETSELLRRISASELDTKTGRFKNNSLGLPHAHFFSVCLFPWVCVVCGARGSEAQRAEAAARHQGRSTPGGENNLGLIPEVYLYFFHDTGGLSGFFHDTGGLSRDNSCLCVSKHVYAFSSSSESIFHTHLSPFLYVLIVLCSILIPMFLFAFFFFRNLICTCVTCLFM